MIDPLIEKALGTKFYQESLPSNDRGECLKALAQVWRNEARVTNWKELSADVMDIQEDRVDLIVSPGVWLPHLRSHNVKGLLLSVGKFETPARFLETESGPDIKFAILIAAPTGMVSEYQRCVGSLLRVLEQLADKPEEEQAASAESLHQLLKESCAG
ncbi:MAG: PTS sugar transporter subunit IIA [Verrucomicrobiales bacterium]